MRALPPWTRMHAMKREMEPLFDRFEIPGTDPEDVELHAVEARLGGVPGQCVVRYGEPAKEILREAEAFGADLIAVSTAGRGGIRRVAFGSVAEAVFRKAGVAVVLFHPGHDTAT